MTVSFRALLAGLAISAASVSAVADEPTRINKINWCIHAYCWSLHGTATPKGRDADLWQAQISRELRLHADHMEAISNMAPDQALVIYPIGNPPPQRQMIAHAKRVLGPRCVVITRQTAGDEVFAGVKDPIRKFLDDPDWPERDKWIHDMLTEFGKRPEPQGIADELRAEVRAACAEIGYDWAPAGIEVAYYQRMIAYDIKAAFHAGGLVFDPATVECVAYGEGFEECAMTWKSMVGHYLGLANPIENDYERSVSGAPFLAHATFKERVALSDNVRLFLWEGTEGQYIALYTRAGVRLRDPQYYAHFDLASRAGGRTFTLQVKSSFTGVFWESQSHTIIPIVSATAPAFAATRRGGDDYFLHLIGSGEPFEDFRARMAAAKISTKPH